MKSKYFLLSILFAGISVISLASNTDTIKVAGNCGMCKNNIETAAKEAGAVKAVWDKTSKLLVVEYDAEKTSNMAIQQKVAEAGYDTQNVKATKAAYNELDKCCQYKRESAKNTKASCCKDMKSCSKDGCCKDDMSCCSKDKATDCCKDGKCKSGR